MYSSFYNFTAEPFNITPDARFLFLTDSHREALSAMAYGIRARKGFILISGEVGTGKTTLLHYLVKVLDPTIKTVFISRINLKVEDLLQDILAALNIPLGDGSIPYMIRRLSDYLKQTPDRGENLAILIDEAQNLSRETLEGLRMLSNIETGEAKLLQIVLVGQPELERNLNSEELRQLKQRIWIRRKIRTITEEECRRYIDHRLKKGGSSSSAVFSPEALSLICKFSGGIIRNVNILCDNALLIGYALQQKRIDDRVVREALADMEISVPQEQARPKILPVPKSIPLETAEDILFAQETGISLAHRALSPWVLLPLLPILALGAFFFLGGDYFKAVSQPKSQKFPVSSAVTTPKAPAAEPGKKYESPPNPAPGPAGGEKPAVPENRPGVYMGKILVERQEQRTADPEPQWPKPSGDLENRPMKIIQLKNGDTLFSVAHEHYPRANMTLVDHIMEFNPEIQNVDLVKVGQKIRIPAINEESFFSGSPETGYQIHLGTFSGPESAVRYRKEPALQGKKIAVIQRKMSPDAIWYRLSAGRFDTREEVLKTMGDLKKKGLLPAFSNGAPPTADRRP